MDEKLTLQYDDDDVCVDIGNGYLMRIGKRHEVARESFEQIVERIHASLAWRRYYGIATADKVVH